MRKFKKGQRVYWNDPAGETSGEYTVLDAHEEKYQNYTDEDVEDYDDRIILIGDAGSEAEVSAEELDILCPLSTDDIQRVQMMQEAMDNLRNDMLMMIRETVEKYDEQRLEHPDGRSYTFHDEGGDKCEVIAIEIIENDLTVRLEYGDLGIERNIKARYLDIVTLYEIMVQMIDD